MSGKRVLRSSKLYQRPYSSFRILLLLFKALQASAKDTIKDFRQNSNDLATLYMNGCKVKASFERIMAEIAKATNAKDEVGNNLPITGNVKKIWRAMEKTGLRADEKLRWRADNICDIIRCMRKSIPRTGKTQVRY